MDHISSTERDFVVDLESCRSTSEEARSTNSPLNAKSGDTLFTSVCNDDGEEISRAENGMNMNRNIKDGADLSPANIRVFIDKTNLVEKKAVKEKRKSMSAKKPPKPPRPPRGFSLDAADQKLIKEIAELAMIKRARIERIKALKKMKAAKASSASSTSSVLNGSFLALLFTVFFLFLLLFQGMSYRSSAMSFHNSVQSDSVKNRFIIVQDRSNLSTSNGIFADSGSSDPGERASGLTHGNSPKSVTS